MVKLADAKINSRHSAIRAMFQQVVSQQFAEPVPE
jgi:hypothetical protein